MSELPEPLATLELHPGDQLVIVLSKGTTPESMERFCAAIRENWPPHLGRPVVIAGVEQLGVIRGERAEVSDGG